MDVVESVLDVVAAVDLRAVVYFVMTRRMSVMIAAAIRDKG